MLPTSCRFLEGMEWQAKEDWMSPSNDPDSPEERFIFVQTRVGDMSNCHCVFLGQFANEFPGEMF